MESREPNIDELESMLDLESDSEFGYPSFKPRNQGRAEQSHNPSLSEWTAQDFSNIYSRFRPHLERHAKRYISSAVSAEEVVQDAFLYLLTALPEIDSEEGVLRFLKWKVKMLCLDSLRSSERLANHSYDEGTIGIFQEDRFVEDLERQEDAAVVQRALASLSPRHRAALVASVYQEKTTSEIAREYEMTENAARQLLLRARRAFKSALVGEAAIEGKSIAQILSIAAKKAAAEAHKGILGAGVAGLVVIMAVGIFGPVDSTTTSRPIETSYANLSDPGSDLTADDLLTDEFAGGEVVAHSADLEDLGTKDGLEIQLQTPDPQEEVAEEEPEPEGKTQPISVIAEPEPVADPLYDFGPQDFTRVMSTDVSVAGIYSNSQLPVFSDIFDNESIEVFGGTGISAFIDFDGLSASVSQLVFQVRVGQTDFFGIPGVTEMERLISPQGSIVRITARDITLVDLRMNTYSSSPLMDSSIEIQIALGEEGRLSAASLRVVPDGFAPSQS